MNPDVGVKRSPPATVATMPPDVGCVKLAIASIVPASGSLSFASTAIVTAVPAGVDALSDTATGARLTGSGTLTTAVSGALFAKPSLTIS